VGRRSHLRGNQIDPNFKLSRRVAPSIVGVASEGSAVIHSNHIQVTLPQLLEQIVAVQHHHSTQLLLLLAKVTTKRTERDDVNSDQSKQHNTQKPTRLAVALRTWEITLKKLSAHEQQRAGRIREVSAQ
jgi:hypothetical protein